MQMRMSVCLVPICMVRKKRVHIIAALIEMSGVASMKKGGEQIITKWRTTHKQCTGVYMECVLSVRLTLPLHAHQSCDEVTKLRCAATPTHPRW